LVLLHFMHIGRHGTELEGSHSAASGGLAPDIQGEPP